MLITTWEPSFGLTEPQSSSSAAVAGPVSAAELIILVLDHILAAMAYADYDDATELLETYGT